MPGTQVCDHGGCPALALHEVDLGGADFHFCHHHWVELLPALADYLAPVAQEVASSAFVPNGVTTTATAPSV